MGGSCLAAWLKKETANRTGAATKFHAIKRRPALDVKRAGGRCSKLNHAERRSLCCRDGREGVPEFVCVNKKD